MSSAIHTCATCGTNNTAVVRETSILLCKKCGTVLLKGPHVGPASEIVGVPEDWSFVQIGTSGIYKSEPFTVIGRVRLQLRSDYKNLWCGVYRNGDYVWVMESFASFAVLRSQWQPYNKDVRSLYAGNTVRIEGSDALKGEYVEKCEGLSFEGEVGNWKNFSPGFFFIQASNVKGSTAVFPVVGTEKIEFLAGEKIAAENLQLKNIVVWNEWK